ncbi:MAG: hypothetical protein HS113_30865 [Verrucomicrobiales bacterium]|nr:hypothetical protein [Verrucomicrobiales bacterium]
MIYERYYLDTLVAGGESALLDPPSRLAPNDLVTVDAGPGAAWVSRLDISLSPGQPFSGPLPLFNKLPYVGVRVAAPDGTHTAWINVNDRRVFGYQSQPGEPIRVGSRPAPPPPLPHESLRYLSIDLDGGGIDFVVRVREWTNAVTGVEGVSAVLTNRADFSVLVTQGWLEGAAVSFAWPPPDGTVVPVTAPAPASWQTTPAHIIILEERRNAGGDLLLRAGPLAGVSDTLVAVRSSQARGWFRFNRDFKLIAQDFTGAACGEPPRQAYERTRQRFDLDGDGRIEYVTVTAERWAYDHMEGAYGWRSQALHPVGHVRRSGAGFEKGDVIGCDAVTPADWVSEAVTLRLEEGALDSGWGPQTTVYDKILGLQFGNENGLHAAWLRPSDGESAYEPRPGTGLRAGEVPRSLWAGVSGQSIIVTWNASLSQEVLESAGHLSPGDWDRHPGVIRGRAVLPLEGASRYFRLAQP